SKSWLEDFLQGEGNGEKKKVFVRHALIEMFKGYEAISLADLLMRLGELVNHIKDDYGLYLSDFSFQKVKDEVERQKLEFLQKFNAAFSGIQNQLIAVPAALLLAGASIVQKSGWHLENILILLAYGVFAAFMTLTIRNQRNTLEAINDQVDEHKQQIEREHLGLSERFEESYDKLGGRYKHQKNLLRVVDGLIALSLLIITALVVWFALT